MQLWFARGAEVSLHDQLVTQIVLGVLSGDLAPGQRLPSTRALARRFRLHPNTVSAGYRQLERDRWVEFRRGSGVYIRQNAPEVPASSGLALDQLIANFFRAARKLGAPLPGVRARLRRWIDLQPPDHFLVIEPDENLREIVAKEMRGAVTLAVKGCGIKDCGLAENLEGAIPVSLPSKTKMARQALPAGAELITLSVRSVPDSLAGWLPAPPGALVGIASRWPDFLKLGRTMLVAAGIDARALVIRDARKPNWRRGLRETAAVVCDSLTATDLPEKSRIVFPLLSESCLAELRECENFISSPLIIQR